MKRPAPSNLLIFIIAAVVSFVLVGIVDKADATPPSSVHTGKHGVVDHGWVRTLCSVDDDGARCAIRLRDDLSEVRVRYYLDGKPLADVSSYGAAYVPNFEQHRAPLERVVRGVHVRCKQSNAVATCDLYLARRYGDFNVGVYAANWSQGGMTGKNVEML